VTIFSLYIVYATVGVRAKSGHITKTSALFFQKKKRLYFYFILFLSKRRVASKELGNQNVLKREKETKEGDKNQNLQ